MFGPDGGFNGSVISFFFSPFICFFDLSFPFQLAGNPDGDAKLAACDRFFLESIEFVCCSSLIYLLIFFAGFLSGISGKPEPELSGTRNVGY